MNFTEEKVFCLHLEQYSTAGAQGSQNQNGAQKPSGPRTGRIWGGKKAKRKDREMEVVQGGGRGEQKERMYV